MSSPPPSPGVARSAAAVNADIRALVLSCGGWLYGEARERYEALRDEWTVACARERMLGDVVTAA
ncbi:hypothetical protein ACFC08_00055 [Streptomyces sp. NPDC056112]|uniref:hypothetical protein n=1 Tax=Streptomyces sp. NPDC056112 TaxID=3345715 RepID=UPI0035DA4490